MPQVCNSTLIFVEHGLKYNGILTALRFEFVSLDIKHLFGFYRHYNPTEMISIYLGLSLLLEVQITFLLFNLFIISVFGREIRAT